MRGGTRAAVLLLLFAAACGSPPSTAIRIGFSAWPGWFPWQIAMEQGLFAQAGLDVELRYYDVYVDSISDLGSGALDANSQTLGDTLGSVASGSDQVIVLVNDNSEGNDQCIVSASIQTIADLQGATIAVEAGVVDHYLLLLALRQAAIDPESHTIVNESTEAAAEDFARGQYDGVCVFAPFTTTAAQRAGSHVLFSSAMFPGAIPDYLVVSRALVNDRPADVQRLVDTWWATRQFMVDQPAQALEIQARLAMVSESDYQGYAAGTRLFDLSENLMALGTPPMPCDALGSEAVRYTECEARQTTSFLLNDAQLISGDIPAAQLQATWTDRFVADYATRHP